MRKYIGFCALFLASFSASAGPVGGSPAVPSLTVGGRVFTDLSNLITLYGYLGSNGKTTFRKTGAVSGYQVTSGKTLTLAAIRCFNDTAYTAGAGFQLFYSDNDTGVASVTVPTNPVYYGNDAANGWIYQAQSGVSLEQILNFPIPSGKYVGGAGGASNSQSCWLFGYEQ